MKNPYAQLFVGLFFSFFFAFVISNPEMYVAYRQALFAILPYTGAAIACALALTGIVYLVIRTYRRSKM